MNMRGGALSAEIAGCPLAHIFGKIGALAFSGLIGDTETLQLLRRGLHALASRLLMSGRLATKCILMGRDVEPSSVTPDLQTMQVNHKQPDI